MKIIIVGGGGTLGRAIVNELNPRHHLLIASRHGGEIEVDASNPDSILSMYEQVGPFDALINAAGSVPFKAINEISAEDYREGIQNKLLSQVNLVLLGTDYINDGGSFTLTSGILNHDPIVGGSAAALVDGGIDGFVTSASIEMPRGIRLNAVSPTIVAESVERIGSYFQGFPPVPVKKAALAFVKSVEGKQNGKVFKVWD